MRLSRGLSALKKTQNSSMVNGNINTQLCNAAAEEIIYLHLIEHAKQQVINHISV